MTRLVLSLALLWIVWVSSVHAAGSPNTWVSPCTLDVVLVTFQDATVRAPGETYNYHLHDRPHGSNDDGTYPDRDSSYTRRDFERLFSGGYEGLPDFVGPNQTVANGHRLPEVFGSVRAYYDSVSNGLFQLHVRLVNPDDGFGYPRWVELPQTKGHYAETVSRRPPNNPFWNDAEIAAWDSVQCWSPALLDPAGVTCGASDLPGYAITDLPNNSYSLARRVRHKVAYVYSGPVFTRPGFIGLLHPQADRITATTPTDSTHVGYRYVMGERQGWGNAGRGIDEFAGIFTHAHEVGHLLGFRHGSGRWDGTNPHPPGGPQPNTNANGANILEWGVMQGDGAGPELNDNGYYRAYTSCPNPLNPFYRLDLGWLNPTEITESQNDYVIAPGTVHRVTLGDVSFLLERRRLADPFGRYLKSYEYSMADPGLFIWRRQTPSELPLLIVADARRIRDARDRPQNPNVYEYQDMRSDPFPIPPNLYSTHAQPAVDAVYAHTLGVGLRQTTLSGTEGGRIRDPGALGLAITDISRTTVNDTLRADIHFTPFMPATLTAEAGNGQVILNWAPPSTNAATIEGYEYSDDGGMNWTPVTGGAAARRDTITGLTNGTMYTFAVHAVNAAGAGPPSASASATPAGRPGAPTLAVEAGDGQVVLRWSEPANNGSPLLSYEYRQRSEGTSWLPDWTTVDGGASADSLMVTELTNGTLYTFGLRAVNAVGAGDSTEVVATPQALILGRATVRFAENGTDTVAVYTSLQAGVGWSLTGTDADSLTIDGSGQVRFRSPPDFEAPADADTDNVYAVSVVARVGPLADTLAVTVAITNAEDAGTVVLSPLPPQVGQPLMATLADEDGSIIGPGPHGKVLGPRWQWYRWVDGQWWFFSTAGPPFTPPASHAGLRLQVSARYVDGYGTAVDTAWSVETAPIVAAANRAPVIAGPDTVLVSFAEDALGAVASLTATDADGGALTWYLAGPDSTRFTLGGSSGVLRFASAPNYEGPTDHGGDNVYQAWGIVRDAGPPPLADSVWVRVSVQDADDLGTLALSSLTPQVGDELKATLTDEENPTWDWSYFHDNEVSGFNGSDGAERSRTLSVSTVHLGSRLLAQVSYTDRHGDQSAHSDTTAAVVGPPWKPQLAAPEPGDGQVGLRWSAPVRTGGSAIVRYEYWYNGEGVLWSPVVGGALADSVTVGGLTNGQAYTLAVRAVNQQFGAGAADSTQATPQATNDAPAIAGPDSVSFAENDPSAVGTYTATDADGDGITWSKAGADASRFTVGGQSGVLAFARPPNYEQPADANSDRVYVVAVIATDNGMPPLADTLAVSVQVTDADEKGTVDVSTQQPQVDKPITLTLRDEDRPLSGILFNVSSG